MAAHSVWWVRDMVTAALILHICGGSVGLISGAAALVVRKGERPHRWFGNAFFGSMLTMGAMATVLGMMIPDRGNVPGGMFTAYLVATGWATVRRSGVKPGLFEYGALLLALAAAGVAVMFAVEAATSATGLLDRKPAPLYAIFACLAGFAVILDVKVILRPTLGAKQRIARHIWRMCAALFFASGSFFLGQQQVMPLWVQGSPLLIAPAIAPLMLMIFWLIRIQFKSRLNLAPLRSMKRSWSERSRRRTMKPAI
jgi:hypothetical protein